MEEELQKRNTDCVYFLASPLTCKKGAECEYRHSEMARLNPRDCWYWMSGSCLNPNCAFRHPPLDAHMETSSEPALNQSAVPPKKIGVPCYFFQNGYCNKGERCSFLHGPVDNLPTRKSSNTTSVNPDGQFLEKKTSVGSDAGSAPVGTCSNSFETTLQRTAGMKKAPQLSIPQSATTTTIKSNASPLTSGSPYEDAEAGRSNSPQAAAAPFQRRSHTSSPGFDVLVDDGSEELDYEDDPEQLVHHDGEDRELNGQYLQYDYEENTEEDPSYTGSSFLYRKERHDYDGHLGAKHTPDYVRDGSAHSKGSVLDRIMPHKRTSFPREFASNGQHNMDLRDLLKKRRMVDGHTRNHVPRTLESSDLIRRSKETPRFQGEQWLQGGRASKQGQDRLRCSHFDRSRLQEKPQLLLSEVYAKAASRKRTCEEDTMEFTGPKTLAQIKDEKKRSKKNGDTTNKSNLSGGIDEDDFRGPKTLREILNEKRRLAPIVDGNTHSC